MVLTLREQVSQNPHCSTINRSIMVVQTAVEYVLAFLLSGPWITQGLALTAK